MFSFTLYICLDSLDLKNLPFLKEIHPIAGDDGGLNEVYSEVDQQDGQDSDQLSSTWNGKLPIEFLCVIRHCCSDRIATYIFYIGVQENPKRNPLHED